MAVEASYSEPPEWEPVTKFTARFQTHRPGSNVGLFDGEFRLWNFDGKTDDEVVAAAVKVAKDRKFKIDWDEYDPSTPVRPVAERFEI